MQWKTDWRLRFRMGGVMVMLVALYAIFMVALGLWLNSFILTAILIGVFAIGISAFGDNIALKASGATKVDENEYPELHSRVARLAQQAQVEKPDVAVASTNAPNAFATGWSESSSIVCVTEGLMDTLDDDELDAVIAHELAHVKNRDVAIMTIASALSAMAGFVVRWGWLGDSDDWRLLVAILISAVVWILSFFVLRLLSRYREYAADRGGAVITGQPTSLASAIMKIDSRVQKMPKKDLREAGGVQALNFFNYRASGLSRLLDTHPPTEKRVERLQELEKEMTN